MNSNGILQNILYACSDNTSKFTDVIVHEGYPIIAQSPSGNAPMAGPALITHNDLVEFANDVCALSSTQDQGMAPGMAKKRLDAGAIKEALDFDFDDGAGKTHSARLRCTIVRTRGGKELAAIVRRIPQEIPSLKDLGLPAPAAALLREAGLVIITGPTKQGKSTTAAAMLKEIRDSRPGHIVTIEDPIEYVLTNSLDNSCLVTSREVGSDVSSYREGAEDALRMNPTAIMIGEIRDEETARAALNLGESGHLVISTMQATTVEGAIFKLWALTASHPGAQASISSCLRGIIRTSLIPSKDRSRYVSAYEFMLNQGEFAKQITTGDAQNNQAQTLRGLLDGRRPAHGTSLNLALQTLVREGKISVQSAKEHTNDPAGLAAIGVV